LPISFALHGLPAPVLIIDLTNSFPPKYKSYICAYRDKNVYNILAGKREGMRPLGRPRSRWEDNTEIE
jgi:hypothetical protein